MHAVIRTYSGKGAKQLFNVLEQHKSDVERVMRSVKGFAGYALIRTAEGGVSVTVCEDKAGTDDSVRKAREWINIHAGDIEIAAPTISEGPIILSLE